MTTRAKRFELLTSGFFYHAEPVSGAYVKFCLPGTTTAKNAYSDSDKSVPFSKVALDAYGCATAYGDGVYKLQLYDGDPDVSGSSVLRTVDYYNCQSTIGNYRLVTSSALIDSDDAFVEVSSSGGAVTITFETVEGFTNPVVFFISDNTNTITFNPYMTETVNGESSLVATSQYQTIVFYPDSSNSLWRADTGRTRPAIVSITSGDNITATEHEGRKLVMNSTSATALTLPAATGSGACYHFIVGTVNTNGYSISVNSSSATIDGCIMGCADGGNSVNGWETVADTSDTITLNGTTTGGVMVGDWVELIDIATNKWAVKGQITQSGTEATPFSAGV